jgi:DNA-binding CsgD family transcriptional regulator
MNGYMTTKEAAEKWNITVRQVQNHCKQRCTRGTNKIKKKR